MTDLVTTPFIKNVSVKTIPGFSGICYQCHFEVDDYSDSTATHLLGENLHGSLSTAVNKRKSEFVAGRYLAGKALKVLGADQTTVGIGANREPLWPSRFIGSISHTKGFAICAVANSNDETIVGLDVENYIEEKTARNIADSILIKPEYEFVNTIANPNAAVLTLIFSAKESLFKALHPEVGHYFGFEAAQTKTIDFESGTIVLELVQQLTPNLPVGSAFELCFELDSHKVFTLCCSQV